MSAGCVFRDERLVSVDNEFGFEPAPNQDGEAFLKVKKFFHLFFEVETMLDAWFNTWNKFNTFVQLPYSLFKCCPSFPVRPTSSSRTKT